MEQKFLAMAAAAASQGGVASSDSPLGSFGPEEASSAPPPRHLSAQHSTSGVTLATAGEPPKISGIPCAAAPSRYTAPVHIDVGGVTYTSSLETLTRWMKSHIAYIVHTYHSTRYTFCAFYSATLRLPNVPHFELTIVSRHRRSLFCCLFFPHYNLYEHTILINTIFLM